MSIHQPAIATTFLRAESKYLQPQTKLCFCTSLAWFIIFMELRSLKLVQAEHKCMVSVCDAGNWDQFGNNIAQQCQAPTQSTAL